MHRGPDGPGAHRVLRVLQKMALGVALAYAALALVHLATLTVAPVSCRVFLGGLYMASLMVVLYGWIAVAPLWLLLLVTLGVERRLADVLKVLGIVGLSLVAAVYTFGNSLFYCDGDALARAAAVFHGS